MKSMPKPKRYTYGQIMAVGRQLRQLENLLNNFEQFERNYRMVFPDMNQSLFDDITYSIVSRVSRYRAIYDNMLKTIK